jgi:hypothetical protein
MCVLWHKKNEQNVLWQDLWLIYEKAMIYNNIMELICEFSEKKTIIRTYFAVILEFE